MCRQPTPHVQVAHATCAGSPRHMCRQPTHLSRADADSMRETAASTYAPCASMPDRPSRLLLWDCECEGTEPSQDAALLALGARECPNLLLLLGASRRYDTSTSASAAGGHGSGDQHGVTDTNSARRHPAKVQRRAAMAGSR